MSIIDAAKNPSRPFGGSSCPTTWAALAQQGYTYERGTLFEGWEIYDKRGHHVDNLYFDAHVPFFKPWPKDFEDIENADPIVEAMVAYFVKNGSPIEHGMFK